MRELRIHIAEFLADALDEGAHIHSETEFAAAGGEPFAMDNVVKVAVADVPSGARDQIFDDLKLGKRQINLGAVLEHAAHVAVQFHRAIAQDIRAVRRISGGRAFFAAVENDLKAAK